MAALRGCQRRFLSSRLRPRRHGATRNAAVDRIVMNEFLDPFANSRLSQHGGAAKDWAHGFAVGRLAGLAACFSLVPFAFAMPVFAREAVPVLVATTSLCALGLLGLRVAAHAWQATLLSLLGLLALVGGYWAGLAPATLAVALLAIALEVVTVPGRRNPRLIGTASILALGLASLLMLGGMEASSLQALLAAALLPMPAIVTTTYLLAAMQKGAERESLRATHAALRGEAMLSAADAAIVIVERGGHVVDATEAASAMFSAATSAIGGRGLVERVLIADRPAFLKAASDAAIGGVATAHILRLALRGHASGAFGPQDYASVSLEFRPVPGAGQQASIRLAPVAVERARSPFSERENLFATLSHEVRTPMNAILGFAEMLANPALCPSDKAKVAEYAAIIHRSARDSFAVTRAVIDLLRVDHESFSAAHDPVDLDEMLRACIAQIASREDEHAVLASIHGAGQINTVEADPKAVRMLLSTLVEGFSAAVGFPATIDCTFSMFGMRPMMELSIAPSAAGGHAVERIAFVGVIRVLAARLAGEIDAELTLNQNGASWHATLIFNAKASVVPLRPADAVSANIVPLRKSA